MSESGSETGIPSYSTLETFGEKKLPLLSKIFHMYSQSQNIINCDIVRTTHRYVMYNVHNIPSDNDMKVPLVTIEYTNLLISIHHRVGRRGSCPPFIASILITARGVISDSYDDYE